VKTFIFLTVAFFCIFNSCTNKNVDDFDNQVLTNNKFKSTELQKILKLQNDRNTKSLIGFLGHDEVSCREAAVLALASVQDVEALTALFDVLENEESIKVRSAAAFAIGQIGNNSAEKKLVEVFAQENSSLVKACLLECLGKCGSDSSLGFLINIIDKQEDSTVLNGAILGIARFSLRGIHSDSSVKKLLSILTDKKSHETTKYYASIAFSRLKDFDLTPYFNEITVGFKNTSNIYTKMNLALAFSRTNGDESVQFLKEIIDSETDFRIKVNAIKSLNNFEYDKVNGLLFKSLNDRNVNIAIQASEYFLSKGISKDANNYLAYSKSVSNWRVRTNLLNAALKFSENKASISSYIISVYKSIDNIYEKANLLKALGGDVSNYQFVSTEVNLSVKHVIKSYGMEALVDMRRNPEFTAINEKNTKQGKPDLINEFASLFKNAILSGDAALVAIAAEVIRDPKLDFRPLFKNSYFLNQALIDCKMPKEIETYRELQKTIAFINGVAEPAIVPIKPAMPDLLAISQILYNQNIEINTSKGTILLELYVNQAPTSVANFLELISHNYFNNKTIHRTVPNFVVQDGCPRGDGWGGPDYVICSEFAQNYFIEGSLGMASAGKDTESSQWFITNSPTPHLDGKYSNFGKVVQGMEVVQLLEVGDSIFSIKIINN